MTRQTDDMLNHIVALEDRLVDMRRAHEDEDDANFELAVEESERLLRLLRGEIDAIALGPQTEPDPQPGDPPPEAA